MASGIHEAFHDRDLYRVPLKDVRFPVLVALQGFRLYGFRVEGLGFPGLSFRAVWVQG